MKLADIYKAQKNAVIVNLRRSIYEAAGIVDYHDLMDTIHNTIDDIFSEDGVSSDSSEDLPGD